MAEKIERNGTHSVGTKMEPFDFMQDEIAITIDTYDGIAEDYCRHTRKEAKQEPRVREATREYMDYFLALNSKSDPIIADIGCGDGRDSKYMIDKGYRVLSIDASIGMLRQAKGKVEDSLMMDIRDIGLADMSVDGVWLCGALWHLPKKELPKAI